eukprot:CAMPEP_0171214610 /NCGR_PEP_ID=MMETSP0790-20130122/31246_1 /TAXON_ID=2925 /ORGANISM="Alexandrium catenella, Strain OF101" /LENGTH=364 /DNA_ID=CAMNT_0011680349 /DNA_START=79 /DNA_END=1173 /DNA_ORIENTATION=+
MPVWIPWLKVNQQAKGGSFALGDKGGGGKGWTPSWQSAGDKGWGKGGKGFFRNTFQRGPRKPPQAVPESFEINPETRYTGNVKFYKKFGGFGFVDLAQKGVVPTDAVYVHWKALHTEDRFPQLNQDMQVELSIAKVKDFRNGTWTLKGKAVTLPGGALIAVQDEFDAQTKQFVGGQHLRYTGQMQFFSPKRGFGWLTMDEGYALTEPVPNELRVDLPEVNAGGRQPPFMREIAVEFGIMKTNRGGYKGYNMTLPGGIPMTQEGLEHRVVLGSRNFTGVVEMYNWQRGWGFIKGAPGSAFPPNLVAKIKQMQEDSAKRGKTFNGGDTMLYFRKEDFNDGVELDKGQQVTFKVYTDDKGAGACEIH